MGTPPIQHRAPEGRRLRIICFAGAGRSGSTLLAQLLGAMEGFVNVGEAAAFVLDPRARARAIPCACGQPVSSCTFWGDIVGGLTAQSTNEATPALLRMRGLPRLLVAGDRGRFADEVRAAREQLRSLFCTVANHTGARVVVDSSKNPGIAYLLTQMPEFDVSVVHLVRDPRGFVSSRRRAKTYLGRLSPPRAVAVWVTRNLAAELLQRVTVRVRQIRYEDFVDAPARFVEDIASWVDGTPRTASFITAEGEAQIGLQHILMGNPDKLGEGAVRISRRSWNLPWPLRLGVTTATLPLILRYGYLHEPSRADRGRSR